MPTLHTETPQPFYPQAVHIEDHYSIFHVAFRHHVDWEHIYRTSLRERYAERLLACGWAPHPYLFAANNPYKTHFAPRNFMPNQLLSRHVSEVMFGETLFSGDPQNVSHLSKYIAERLAPDQGRVKMSEPLVFSLCNSPWLNTPLQLTPYNAAASQAGLSIQIHWVDLFLFGDGTGVLALKADCLPEQTELTLDTLSQFHTLLRQFKSTTNSATNMAQCGYQEKISGQRLPCVADPATPEARQLFWQDIVLRQWLDYEFDWAYRFPDKSRYGLLQTSHTWQQFDAIFDPFQRYCKILIAARMQDSPSGEASFQWNRPVTPMPLQLSSDHFKRLNSGDWDTSLASAHHATLEGYPVMRDLVLAELALMSAESASMGGKGNRQWQYSIEYIKRLLNENRVDIWEYWQGLGIRDNFAFLAHHQRMDEVMMQAVEGCYYPLYLLAYSNRFRLDQFSRRIVDHDMFNVFLGHEIMDQFQRFRNQYWFREVTIEFQGVEIFSKMNACLQNNAQYTLVSKEIAEVSQHQQVKWNRDTKLLLVTLLFLFAPLAELSKSWLLGENGELTLWFLPKALGVLFVFGLCLTPLWLRCRGWISRGWIFAGHKTPRLANLLSHAREALHRLF